MATIHDQLTCSICLELYQEPVRLACFHAFCRKCIADNLNIPHRNQVCPECNAHIGNIISASSLKKDFKLAALVQAVKEMPKCSEHNDTVDTLEECKAEVFCQTCCKLLCVRCAFSAKHKNHDMEDLKTAIAKQKDAYVKRIGAVKRKMKDYNEQLCETKKARLGLDTLEYECTMTFNKMIRELEASVNQLKSKGECEIQTQAQKLCNQYREKESDLRQKVKYGENLLKNTVDVEKDPIRSVQILKEDAENSYDFDNPLPDIPKKATIAEVFKRCPEIEKSCLKLKKLAYRYVKEIRGGTFGSGVQLPSLFEAEFSYSDQNSSQSKVGIVKCKNLISKTTSVEKPCTSEKLSTSAAVDSSIFGDTKASGISLQNMLFGLPESSASGTTELI